MNLSREWLNEFVKVTASDKEFAEAMTLSGSKVEITTAPGEEIKNVVVGLIVIVCVLLDVIRRTGMVGRKKN